MNFKQYCFHNNLYTSNIEKTTHLFMDGGKLSVQSEDYPQFLLKYLESINRGEKISLVEKLGKNCEMRFFLDIDSYINIDNIIDISKKVLKCEDFSVFQCNKRHGIHIIFNKVVTNIEALNFCKTIKQLINNDEADHIDSSVYNTGLRMVGSIKYKDGKPIDRFYLPIHYDTNDVLHMKDLKKSIVRIKTLDFQQEAICNECCESDFDVLKKYIMKIDSKYEYIKLTHMKMLKDYFVIYTNSRYCTNIKKEHNSVGIYFVINPKRELYQKCFCPCKKLEDRIQGYCCSYKSVKIQIPKYVYSSISPKKV